MLRTSNNFYSAIKPLFYSTKIFGLVPFKIAENGPQESMLSFFWTLFVTFLLSSLSVHGIIGRKTKTFGLIMKIWDICNVYIHLITMFVIFVCSYISRKKIMNSIKDISYVDKEIGSIGVGLNIERLYKRSKMWMIFTGFLIIAFLLTLLFLDGISFYNELSIEFISDVAAYTSPLLVKPIMELQFCTLVLLLWQRFSWLNFEIVQVGKYLKQSKTFNDDVNDYKYKVKNEMYGNVSLTMRRIKAIHNQLCKISGNINKAYAVQILLLVLTSFLVVVMTVFYWSLETGETLPETFIVYNYGVILSSCLEVVALAVCCSLTVEEAKRTGSLIHDIMPPNEILPNRRALQLQLSSFSLQLAQYNVEFNACGVFPINETLIYSIVGAASAYLVIVIQFELSNRSGNHTVHDST